MFGPSICGRLSPGLGVRREEIDRAVYLERLVGAVVERRVALVGAREHAANSVHRIAKHGTDTVIHGREAEIFADRDAQTAEVD